MTFPSLMTQTAIPGTSKVLSVRPTRLSMAAEFIGWDVEFIGWAEETQ
jgi:hypothetical protein